MESQAKMMQDSNRKSLQELMLLTPGEEVSEADKE
jgi:hypothetical protein